MISQPLKNAISKLNDEQWKVTSATRNKWLEKVKELEWANLEMDTPYHEDDDYQVLDHYHNGENYCLRIFENKRETFRVIFNDDYIEVFKNKYLGTSSARLFSEPVRQMGYHEQDQIFSCNYRTVDKIGYFKYINLNELKIPIIRLILDSKLAYTVELLQKQGYTKFAELWVNHFAYSDIKKLLKKEWVFKNPSFNKINFALNTKHKYQRGMLKYQHHDLDKLLSIVSFKKWKKLEKQGYDIIDFIDYREQNKKFGFPDFPKNLQEAKEKILKLVEYKENKEINKKIALRVKELESISFKGVTAKPFKSAEELKQNGIDLSMCIFDYRERYAKGEIDLYNVDNTASIEVSKGKVVQCRGKHNKNLYTDYIGLIKEIEKTYKKSGETNVQN